MPRTKSKSAKRHRKIKKEARGFKHARRKRVKVAKESLLHAGQYAYISRRLKKRDFRKLWITRLNAAVRQHGLSYSKFIKALKDNKIELDRKMLAEIAVSDPETFSKIVEETK
jgi:large subunit ribosomal protein L20